MFFDVYKSIYIYSESSFNTLYIEIKNMLKIFSSDKINFTKNPLFFLLQAPTHHSFNFKTRFLYELKRKVHFSKTVCENVHFRFRLIFTQIFI